MNLGNIFLMRKFDHENLETLHVALGDFGEVQIHREDQCQGPSPEAQALAHQLNVPLIGHDRLFQTQLFEGTALRTAADQMPIKWRLKDPVTLARELRDSSLRTIWRRDMQAQDLFDVGIAGITPDTPVDTLLEFLRDVDDKHIGLRHNGQRFETSHAFIIKNDIPEDVRFGLSERSMVYRLAKLCITIMGGGDNRYIAPANHFLNKKDEDMDWTRPETFSEETHDVLRRAVRTQPADRYATIGEFLDAFTETLGITVPPVIPSSSVERANTKNLTRQHAAR